MKKYSKCIIQVMIIIDVDAEEKTMNLYHRFMNHIVNVPWQQNTKKHGITILDIL